MACLWLVRHFFLYDQMHQGGLSSRPAKFRQVLVLVSALNSVRGDFLNIIGWDPSISKFNRFNGMIYRFFFIDLMYILSILLKWLVIFLQSWTPTGYYSNSTGASVTSGRFSPSRGPRMKGRMTGWPAGRLIVLLSLSSPELVRSDEATSSIFRCRPEVPGLRSFTTGYGRASALRKRWRVTGRPAGWATLPSCRLHHPNTGLHGVRHPP